MACKNKDRRILTLEPLEVRTLKVGFILAGLVIAVTGVSYLLNMKFQPQFLVWVIGVAFIAVGLITLEWLRVFRTRLSTILVVLMLIVIAFCAVGNALFGFPWQGCVQG